MANIFSSRAITSTIYFLFRNNLSYFVLQIRKIHMAFEDELDEDMRSVLIENNAQTIYDYINDLEKETHVYSKRWFWELLQNAKDSVGEGKQVSVEVELNKRTLSFRHTGDAFAKKDILHLIFHGSSKKTLENKTGRFGTGFMSTHLLSREVVIGGKLTNNLFFNFTLSRIASNPDEQFHNLDLSYKNFKESLQDESYYEGLYQTSFIYQLSDETFQIAQTGIRELEKILPFVMAFNPKIESIRVIENDTSFEVRRGMHKKVIFERNNYIEQQIIQRDSVFIVLMVCTQEFDVAVLIEEKNNQREIVYTFQQYPHLFFDFPLFGTERIGFPVVINSNLFDVKGERDGIYLTSDNKTTILTNKKIINDALKILPEIIEVAFKNGYKNIFYLYQLDRPFEYTWLENKWLIDIYIELISNLLNSPVLKINETDVKLKNLRIPYSLSIQDTVKYNNLLRDLFGLLIPADNYIDTWIGIGKGYSIITDNNLDSYSFILTSTKVCSFIEQKSSIQTLFDNQDDLEENRSKGLKWLNDFINLHDKAEFENLISRYKVIPNQHCEFVLKKIDGPYLDKIGDNEIRSVIRSFGWDIEFELIHSDISIRHDTFQCYTLEKVIRELNLKTESISDIQLKDYRSRNALIVYLTWMINQAKDELMRNAYVIVEEKDNETNYYRKRRLFTNNAEKLLAPAKTWNEKFSLFADLIKLKLILIDEYADILDTNQFSYLESLGYIFGQPLVMKKSITKNELKLLLKNSDDIDEIENIAETLPNLSISDITYLTTTDDNILSKTSDSFKSARTLLRFLLTQVIHYDNMLNENDTIAINNKTIPFRKCLWISRLKETKWIPVKVAEAQNRIQNEKPSANAITELIKDDQELLDEVKTHSAIIFFNLLGISVADIIRNTINDEKEKIAWDMTFSNLISNKNIDPLLAAEMLADPNLQKVYSEQKEIKARVSENKKIGTLFETIFNEIFESVEYRDMGFTINRTAIGSDYGIVYEEDFLDENGNEIKLSVGNCLIELKATGKPYASMTETQAKEAAQTSQHYILGVLPLSNFEINRDNVFAKARFIIDIKERIKPKFERFQEYLDYRTEIMTIENGLSVSIEDGQIRYRVKSDIWEDGRAKSFQSFVEWLKSISA